MPWGTHFCQFYRTGEDLTDILVPYIKAGLENNEFCMWITSQPLEAKEAKEVLRKAISDFDFYLEKGQIEIIPCTHWYIKEGIFDSERVLNRWVRKLNQALTNGYDGLRLTGNTFWLEEKDWNNFFQYEEEVDGVIGNYNMMALCTYSLDRCSATEIIDVVNSHQFALIKKEGKWEQMESSRRKKAEEVLRQSEQHVRMKLENMLSPTSPPQVAELELADIIDARAIHSLMDDFYNFAHITMALVDLKGNVLVNVGWQEICTRFHRVHPEACRHCVESDTKLSAGVAPGEFKLYKCKNNMWDVATPIIVDGRHVGNIFSGQFFFEEETPDYELFRIQARKYGFNEEEYIAALEKVPRLSSETVGTCMAFFMKLAHMISQLGYSNIKMAQSLVERDALMDALQESSERLRQAQQVARTGTFEWNIQTGVNKWTPELEAMYGLPPGGFPGTEKAWEQLVYPEDRSEAIRQVNDAMDTGSFEGDWRVVWPDGSVHWLYGRAFVFKDKSGKPLKLIGINIDITERKQEEYRIRRYNRVLEGINSIFSNVVQAKTEEEVGNACLSVALELTGSEFGFINEMGADGLLHDVAKSELGWERCFMYDKTGHRRPPSFFAVNGLYGSVIINEKSFFTNDPQSHPDSIGIPEGHPPIKSFLGVPLVQEGKTVGLIAVANHEGGYSSEQQEDLEAIAPAVVQALQRKKAEQKRKQAEEALQASEERYRSLYENSLDGILLTKPDGTILCANPQACQMFGMTEDELIRAGREDLVVNDEKLAAALEERKLTGRARAELIYRRKDGATIVCDTTSKFFVGADGNINTCQIIRDISERKQTEEALRASEEKFRQIVETASEGIWLIDSNERTVFVNRKMSEMLSYSIEEILGQSPRKFMSPEFRANVNDRLRELIQGANQVVDYRFIRKDGSELWCIVSSSPLLDDHGKYTGSLAMITDITERKRVEEALRLSNLYNRSLIEASLDPLVTIGRDGKITDVNGATEQVTGYSRNELIGTDFSEYFIDPEKARTGYRRVFTDGEVRDYPLEIQHKDGCITPVLYNASVYRDENGEVIGVFAAARDITERKKAEGALKEAHDNLEKLIEERTAELEKAYNSLKESEKGLAEAQKMAHIGNWEWDIASDKAYWSEEMYRIFGRDPREMAPPYDDYLRYIHPDDRDYYDNAVKKAVKGKPYSIDNRIISANGEERTVHIQSEVIFNEEDNPVRIKGIVQDITERKKAEEALANLEIARKKEIHHRIKNNLQVISSLLDLQAEKFKNRKCVEDSEVLKAFRESQDRVMSIALIHEELHKGKGNNTLDFSPYLRRLAKNLFQTYTLGNANTRLDMNFEEDIFFDIDTAVPLGIIVNELVSNSFKHAFQGRDEGIIKIKLCREETVECADKEDTNNVQGINNMQESRIEGVKSTNFILTVSDNGVGMPENFNIENSDTLGIQLVSILVDQLDGELELKRDCETEFRIRFTVAEKQ